MADIELSVGIQKGSLNIDKLKAELNKQLGGKGSIKIDLEPTMSSKGSATIKKAKQEFDELLSIQKKLASYQKDIITLNPANKPNEYENAAKQIRHLYTEYQRLLSLYSKDLSSDQINKLTAGLKETAEANDRLHAKAADKSFADALKQEAQAAKEAARAEKERESQLTRTVNLQNRAKEALVNYSAAQFNPRTKGAYDSIRDAVSEIDTLKAQLDSGAISAEEFDRKYAELSRTVASSSSVIKQNGMAFQSFGSVLSSLPGELMKYFSAAKLVSESIKFFKEAINASIELESSFAQLQIVTGATDAEMVSFKNTAVDLAKSLGQSVTDVTKSIETFSRLGYSLSESADLAKYATIMSNVASVTQDEATTGLTAIIKGFDMKVSDASHVADVLVDVGQKYAVSAGEMMEAYEKSGAALNATGTSFEKSAGLIAAANAAVQNASTVGTALKTVSARIRGSKTEAAELGEDFSDLADGFSKYREELQQLTGFDIMVEGTTNQFKDLYDIFAGISEVWDKLSDTQRARVSEILGGTRQLQVISSILGNWDDAVGAYETAMNSAGAATQANDVYMETAEAHLKQFKATFQEFSMDLMQTDFLSGFIDLGKYILEAADGIVKLTNKIGGLKTILTATAAVLLTINAGSVFGSISNGIAMLRNIPNMISGIVASITSANVAMAGIITMIAGVALFVKATKDNSFDNRYNTVKELQQESDNLEKTLQKNKDRIEEINALKGTSNWTPTLQSEANELAAENGELSAQIALLQQKISLQEAAAKSSFEREFNNYLGIGASSADSELTSFANWLTNGLVGEVSTDKLISRYKNAVERDNKQDIARYYTDLIDRRSTLNKGLEFYDPEEDAEKYQILIDTIGELDKVLGIAGDTAESTSNELSQSAEDVGDGIDKILSSAEKANKELSELWSSEDFASVKDELIEMAHTLGSVTPEAIEELAGKNKELKEIMDETGMSAKLAAMYFTREALYGDGAKILTDDVLELDAALSQIENRCAGATAALEQFNKAASHDNADTVKSYAQAYKQFLDDWEAGRTGSNTVDAAVNLFFSTEQLEAMGWDLQEAGEKLSSDFYKAIFSTEGDPGANFATYVKDHYTDAWKEAVEITNNADGTFDIAVTSADKLAKAMGTDTDVANAFIDAMGAWGVHLFATGEELEVLADKLGLVGGKVDDIERIDEAIAGLALRGESGTEIKATLEALSDAGYIDTSGIEDLDSKISSAVEHVQGLSESQPDVEVKTNLDEETAKAKTFQSTIDSLHGTSITSTHTIVEKHVVEGGGLAARASGTRNAAGGPTLVNELGPELISENGYAFIANGGKPAIVNLSRGAIVLNDRETRNALGGLGLSGIIKAMASGSHATFPSNYSAGGYSGGGGGGSSSSKSSSSSSNSSSSSDKVETWFERMYKDHKHLLEMDQENVEDFLDWLNDAYKKAYAEGIIELDDYYKYAEEVYSGLQDLFKDHLSDVEHAIDLAERAGDGNTDILNMYQALLNEINAELESAFARGLDENDEYVQYLQNQWYTYYDKLKDARDDAQDDAMDAVDDLVKYRIKMLKQYIKNEIDSLKERLSYLKDFYQKQKDMLKDVADTEDYYDEQNDKRKKVSDIEAQLAMLDLDNSAWAQKRKAKLQEELADAQKDLRKFERDHAIEVAQEELDAAYEIQERAINARIDQLEDLSDNPKALYEQALKDVQNNSVELYEEMIEFNNKYGDGIQKTIVDMWESAYVSLKNYADLYHEFYNGINLVNATGYYPDTSGVGGNYLVRNPGGSGVKTGTVDVPEVTSAATSYVDVDDQTAAMLAQAQAALQAQIDSVLNNVSALQNQALQALQNSAAAALGGIMNQSNYGGINMGDIIINGSATADTISEIRRAQRENVDNMLKEFNKLYSR